jgi:hypothetical protein
MTRWPDDVREIIAHAKELFRLKLLTVNAMWPDASARVQAKDQLTSARLMYMTEACKC